MLILFGFLILFFMADTTVTIRYLAMVPFAGSSAQYTATSAQYTAYIYKGDPLRIISSL